MAPLFFLSATILFFLAGASLQARLKSPLVNPTLVGILLLCAMLKLLHVPYAVYFANVQLLHFLLGPATAALAIPMVLSLEHLRKGLLATIAALLAGCVTGALSAYLLVRVCGGDRVLALSMLPKSVTTPIAMGVSTAIGGTPSLTAVFAILAGVLAAVTGPLMMRLLRVQHPAAVGLGAGAGGGGIAAAAVIPLGPVPAAFAGIAIGVNGLFTALLAPVLARLLTHIA